MALILNIETATRSCSVSVGQSGQCIALKEEFNERFSHAEKLTIFIEELLAKADLKLADLQAIAVSSGPGSYTGLRIGVSAAKGLCYALDIPLISVDTLHAIAHLSTDHPSPCYIVPMIDARRMEAYAAVYDQDLNEIRGVQADIIDEASYRELMDERPTIFLGDGAGKCAEVLGTHSNATILGDVAASAKSMVSLSEAAFSDKRFEDTAYFEPFYLKEFVAGVPKKLL
jgi:tRNA threonylcarbamoyladenosine biosynthesis protein TsaB